MADCGLWFVEGRIALRLSRASASSRGTAGISPLLLVGRQSRRELLLGRWLAEGGREGLRGAKRGPVSAWEPTFCCARCSGCLGADPGLSLELLHLRN